MNTVIVIAAAVAGDNTQFKYVYQVRVNMNPVV